MQCGDCVRADVKVMQVFRLRQVDISKCVFVSYICGELTVSQVPKVCHSVCVMDSTEGGRGLRPLPPSVLSTGRFQFDFGPIPM